MKIETILKDKDVFTIDKDQLLSDALEKMEKNGVAHLIVTDDNKLVGIISIRDIADRLGSTKTKRISPKGLHVSSAMSTNLITIEPDIDVEDAANLMLKEKVGSLAVTRKTNDTEKIVGIITKMDIVRLCSKVDTIRVDQIMTQNPYYVDASNRVIHARKTMFENRVSTLPVFEEGKLVGIVDYSSIAKALAKFRESVAKKHQSERIRNFLVNQVMDTAPPFLKPDATLSEAAQIMLSEGLKGIPVLDEFDDLIGIVTKTDMTKLVANKFKVD
ncbi:MAG: CBS domain-containing protein [Promethearchaeota archaeon]